MSHYTDNKVYYANECGFFAGLGLKVLWDYETTPIKLRHNCDADWYFRLAARNGLLALKEIEESNERNK